MNPYNYIDYIAGRWRLIAAATLVAGALAFGVSLARTPQYTGVARILIEPPAGGDSRVSVAVSPIYLESLRTYELFASSDTLFQKALDQFDLRDSEPGRTIESWKSRVLDVTIPTNTRVMEISVTLPDAEVAQQMAQFVAEQTVKMTRTASEQTDVELAESAAHRLAEAKHTLERAENDWTGLIADSSSAQIEEEIDTRFVQQYRLQRQLDDAQVRLAESAGGNRTLDARAAELGKQLAAVNGQVAELRTRLARQRSREEQLSAARDRARASYEVAAQQAREAQSAIGLRGERLRLIDPGVKPERPSSRGSVVLVLSAMLFAFIGSTGYLAFRLALETARSSASRNP